MLKCEVPRTFFLYPPTQIILILRWKLFSLCELYKKITLTYASKAISYAISVTHLYIHMWLEVYENLIIIVKLVFLFVIPFRKLTFGFWYLYLLFVCPHAHKHHHLHFHRKVKLREIELWFNEFKGFRDKLRVKLMVKDIMISVQWLWLCHM